MSEFKLKVQIGDANIELEGASEFVYKIFSEIREEGLKQLSEIVTNNPKVHKEIYNSNLTEKNILEDSLPDESRTQLESDSIEYPSLQDIKMRSLPKTEAEWVLIYAFYASSFATKEVGRDTIRSMYDETDRFTEARGKNFSTNIINLVGSKYMSAVNSNQFIITEMGKNKVISILNDEKSPENRKKRTLKQTTNKNQKTYSILDLNLDLEERQLLKVFYNQHRAKTAIDKVTIVAHWYKNIKNIDEIDTNIIFTLLRTINEAVSFDIEMALNNAKLRNNYFVNGSEKGKYRLHHLGEDHVMRNLVINK